MKKRHNLLIDFIVFFVALSVPDWFFEDISEVGKCIISVIIVLVLTVILNKFVKGKTATEKSSKK